MLTREQIDKFQRCAARLCEVDPWGPTMRTFATFGLVTVSGEHGCMLTPAGHDLLATIPHLPAPEQTPEAPSCSRCGGSGEVPLFMGPAMMECPECRSGVTFNFSAPGIESLERAAEHMLRLQEQWRAGTVVPREAISGPMPAWSSPTWSPERAGWVHIDSEETARSFVGKSVEIHAPAGKRWGNHKYHGTVQHVVGAGRFGIHFADDGLHWVDRGNVYLRLVSE